MCFLLYPLILKGREFNMLNSAFQIVVEKQRMKRVIRCADCRQTLRELLLPMKPFLHLWESGITHIQESERKQNWSHSPLLLFSLPCHRLEIGRWLGSGKIPISAETDHHSNRQTFTPTLDKSILSMITSLLDNKNFTRKWTEWWTSQKCTEGKFNWPKGYFLLLDLKQRKNSLEELGVSVSCSGVPVCPVHWWVRGRVRSMHHEHSLQSFTVTCLC